MLILRLASVSASDTYFNAAISRIEESLVNPAKNYAFFVTDTLFVIPRDEGALGGKPQASNKEGRGIYVSNGNIKYIHDTYVPQADGKNFRIREVFVWLDKAEKGMQVSVSEGKSNLTHNVRRILPAVGLKDTYWIETNALDNAKLPNVQPIQLLTNPCFAPLTWPKFRLSPVELRRLPVNILTDNNEERAYEFEKLCRGWDCVFHFHFSPKHNNLLAKSDVSMSRRTVGREGELRQRFVRAVERWQQLPDGRLVPARWTMVHEQAGKDTVKLVREISDPIIGLVNENHFKTAEIPEFQVEMEYELDLDNPK